METAYAQIMSMCTEGTYLYTPPSNLDFHPGSCGFFDENGGWRVITDLTELKEHNLNEYKAPKKDLVLTKPATCTWDKKVVEKNEGSGFGAKAEVSGIAAQAPVDVGANFAVGSTAKAGAGVVVSPNVVHKKFNIDARKIIEDWITDNMKQLTDNYLAYIIQFGVWIITATWSTEKCSIAMWNKTGSKIDTGAEIGATNIGKLGVNSSHEVQTDIDEHRVWNEPGGHAISFSGMLFRPSRKFWSKKLKHIQRPKDGSLRVEEAISISIDEDEDGDVLDENGNIIMENGQLIDKDGNFVDKDGNLVDEDGDRVDEDGNPIDEDGNIIPEWSTEVIGEN
ncbi:uncharacterized protein J4E78_002884 [Alternaria triticimaculans]|uniref:uncharacterized protein n=1 Tax=Alternaria triticimaculans TaxID=297637 RepID=UPI0020C3F56B|nr:uncharacterized protein J4E78_002884 [Alternaria triticimaculans]KAI4665423.1 hypothetical protein J4E78_002884 [Alternaria triticimaculans]